MKRKLLLAALCVVSALGMRAQTDVTSTYITNADFSGSKSEVSLSSPNTAVNTDRKIYQPEGWNLDIKNISKNNMTVVNTGDPQSSMFTDTYAPTDGKYMVRFRDNQPSEYIDLSQTFTINVSGVYTISADLIREDDSKINVVVYAGISNASNSSAGTWENCGFDATFFKGQEVKVGVKFTNLNAGGHKAGADNIRIVYKSNYGSTLAALIAQATAINAKLGTLTSEIKDAQDVYDGINNTLAYQATIDNAISTLQSAISTKLAAYTGLNAAGDDITSFILNNGFETSPTFDGTSTGSGSAPKSNATPTAGSTLLYNAKNVYQVYGWELMTTETSDYARTFTMPYNNTLYVQSNNAVAGQAVAAPTNGSSVTTDNNNLLFVEANWCQNAVLGVKQTITLPAGSYRLTFDSYVTTSISNANSLCGVSYGETTNYKWPVATNTWTANEVEFTLDEPKDVTISMGYKKINNVGGGQSAFLFVDNVKLTYFDPLKLAQIQWQEAWDALDALDETALPDAAETAITTALSAEEPTTVEGYNSAKTALQALIDSYADIKTAYESAKDFITAITEIVAHSAGDKATINAAISTATLNIEMCTSASALDEECSTLETARRTYVTSGAEPADGHPFEVTFKIVNPSFENDKKETNNPAGWTIPNKGNQYGAKAKGSMSNVEGNYIFNNWQSWWQDCNVEQTISSLPNGRYIVTAVLASYNGTSANLQAGSGSTDTNMTGENNGIRVSVNGDVTSSSLTIRARAGRKNDGSLLRADDFTLSFIGLKPVLSDLISSATDLPTTNVGTGVFQIPSSAANALSDAISTAQSVYDNSSAYGSTIQDAIDGLEGAINTFQTTELNAPVEGVQYRIKSTAASGASWKDKYYLLKKNPAQQNGGYSISAEATDAAHYATAWVFNPTGNTNQYTISMTDEEGVTRYICTNIKGYDSGSATQIRTTTDATKALVVKVIATTDTEGRWNLQNTEDNSYIGGQDAGLFSNSLNYDLAIEEATKASVNINIKAGKWGTCIFPFVPTLPEGVEAYTYTSVVNNDVLDLTKVDKPVANVPYFLKNTTEDLVYETVQGYGTAKQDSYSGDALVGYYTSDYDIPAGSYVLQTQDGVQAFYQVGSIMSGKGVANRCYLTLPANNNANKRNALFFDKEEGTTGLEAPAATSTDDGILYNVAGQQVNASYKGLIIKNRRVMLNK